jgi:hypothetical protein
MQHAIPPQSNQSKCRRASIILILAELKFIDNTSPFYESSRVYGNSLVEKFPHPPLEVIII